MFEAFKGNSKTQGNAGHGAAIAYYSCLGYNVSIPMTDNCDYDILVDTGEKILKVQCKTTKHLSKNGIYVCCLVTSGGNKSGNKIKYVKNTNIDILFVLCSNGDIWEFPKKVIPKTTINLSCDIKIYFKGKLFSDEKSVSIVTEDLLSFLPLHTKAGCKKCYQCNNDTPSSTRLLCDKCLILRKSEVGSKNLIPREKKFDPNKENLLEILQSFGWNFVKVGKYYGVSDNAVRKRCKKYELPTSKKEIYEYNLTVATVQPMISD